MNRGSGSASAGGTQVGSDNEVRNFMQLLTRDAAKRLSYDRTVSAPTDPTAPTTAAASR